MIPKTSGRSLEQEAEVKLDKVARDTRMLGATSLKASHHGNTKVGRRGSDEDEEERRTCVVDMNLQSSVGLHLQSSESCFQLDDDFKDLSNDWFSTGDPCQDISFSSDSCAKLEKRWMLWYEFMKEHSCLNDWLRSAEKTAATPNSSNVLYCAAKEELQKYESLRAEARIRLVQLDGLSQKSRTLVGLFRGAMCTRLVEMTKDCGQRWDQLSNTMDTVCRRLKHFVCQREDFERQREEMAVWLTDMDLRLTEVEHFSGKDTCSKMHQLQGFQEAVAESAGRLNDLLQRGEELIQRSEPADAQTIENQLQELLLHCTRVFQGLGRLHTRLLSMRLVFEEDWSLCAPDSGCPSESVLEDECFVDRSLAPHSQTCLHQSSQDHLVLEWDPSVDIGGSHDDTDSSSFSAAAGVSEEAGRYPLRRRVYTTPVDSQPDNGAINIKLPGTEKSLERTAPPQTPVPVSSACKPQYAGPFKTSTPETRSSEPVTFDPERISAWLGQTHQLCSKAVQTEHTPQACSSFPSLASSGKKEGVEYQENVLPQGQQTRHTCSYLRPSVSCDLQHHSYGRHKDPQWLQEKLCFSDSLEDNSCTKSSRDPYRLKAPAGRSWHTGSWSLRPLRLFEMRKASASMFVILFALLLALVVWPLISLHSSPCHRSNTLTQSFHLALHYKGPPPT